ncbi:hypothetical protein [Nocardia sp. NPDC050710]|uniref:hypothetical protein n=1 Tax=Nocardia sp. NPDC050710 TaxID=3157220 RepID=UPI0033D5DD0A
MSIIGQYSATDGVHVSSSAPLYFELNTDPDPVRISPSSGDPQHADFVLVGSRRSGKAIECRKITITVPTGTNSADLTPDITSIAPQISLKEWTPRTDPAAKTITFTPTTGFTVIDRDEGVTIQLMDARINSVVGSTMLAIAMEWREVDGDGAWETGSVAINVGKFPPDFRLENFTVEPMIIDNSGSVKLKWEASGVSSLKLLYDVADVDVTNKTTYTVSNITRTTVFYLRGTVQVGNNTVERILSAFLTVRVPDLEVRHLTVRGDLHIGNETALSVSDGFEAAPDHPLEHMFDGSLGTYYLSESPISTFAGWIVVDRGENTPPATSIRVRFGDPSGNHLPHACTLQWSLNGIDYQNLEQAANDPKEINYTEHSGLVARYFRLGILTDTSANRHLAIRSFTIIPSTPLRVTSTSTVFGVPVYAADGIADSTRGTDSRMTDHFDTPVGQPVSE